MSNRVLATVFLWLGGMFAAMAVSMTQAPEPGPARLIPCLIGMGFFTVGMIVGRLR